MRTQPFVYVRVYGSYPVYMDVHNWGRSKDSQRLPAGRHGLTRAAVADSQRGRVLVAMAQAVAEKGYEAATVADVLACARVSRATFYGLFRDKADCYQQAYTTAIHVLSEEVQAGVRSGTTAADGLRAGLRAYLEQLQQDPTMTRAFIVEAYGAPATLQQLRWAAHQAFARQLQQLAVTAARENDATPPPPGLAGTAAVGALVHVVCEALQADPGRDLVQLYAPLEVALGLLLLGPVSASRPA